MEILKNKRYLALAGLCTLLLAIFLPYYSYKVEAFGKVVSEGKVSLIGYWEGYIILFCIISTAIYIFMDFIEKYASFLTNLPMVQNIKNNNPKLVLVPIGIIILVSIYDIISLSKYSFTKFGLGFYFEIIGIICLVAHAILYRGATGVVSSSTTQSIVDINQQPTNNIQQPMMNQQQMNNMQPQQPMMNNQPNMGMQQPQQPMYNGQPMMNQQSQQQMNNNQFPNNNGF